jgi:hypothetical protein
MPRVKRIKLSENRPISNFLRHYGVGGIENYDDEQVDAILRALGLILNNAGLLELEQLGKFLLKLSDNVNAYNKAFEELERMGYLD